MIPFSLLLCPGFGLVGYYHNYYQTAPDLFGASSASGNVDDYYVMLYIVYGVISDWCDQNGFDICY